MLKIKLVRTGRKNLSFYRIVVAEGKSKVSGRVVELLGSYDPHDPKNQLIINKQSYTDWLAKGAQPTLTVKQLVKKLS
ncbi:30S ribosomal protein S16 [Candidatus Collierbacteria bacterium RIFOXYB1_FULL_49_13]|uniref:Small ribosomal subunit protein bS16 n=1 Tax=Candidatus Collierbacteria bacterium RIFOXYB1_FULL_49_13 TaxID=1817728 RepID=A0A1F5FK20_9BACT|nr:MAG: 30S ribosomal protein S16 [Candidatus Collierbacteria bacterium RIFOXYB1_FULL_49_13]